MAKTSAVPAETEGQVPEVNEAKAVPEVPIIIEKYLTRREDIAPSLKRVMMILYKGQTHTIKEWDEIINRRISRPVE